MTRKTIALATLLTLASGHPVLAQSTGAAAGAPPVTRAPVEDAVPRSRDPGPPSPATAIPGNPGPSAIPGSTPGINIGGTPTSGPPGTGGAAGGPSVGQ